MTKQEIFDIVWAQMVLQGGPAMTLGGACVLRVYRDDKVLKCAYGALLTDDEAVDADLGALSSRKYARPDEALGYRTMPERMREHYTFIAELQIAHDAAASSAMTFLPVFQQRATAVALKYGVAVPQ